ncbi:MAG: hypothetical protein ACHQ4H_07000, partial [Ktedonobacterales bacterium]
MRWLPWRRKSARDGASNAGRVAVATRAATDIPAAPVVTVELRGAALQFARDALLLAGARVRVEDADVIAATLPDGTRRRYTDALARARGEQDAILLVPGGAALAALLED